MSTADQVLAACLLASPALAGIKVRAELAQTNDSAPYIVHTQYAGTRVSSLTGDSGLANPKFQVDVYASTKAESTGLKAAIRAAILAEPLLGATLINEGSGYEPETKLYRSRQDFSFWFYD
ncbi:MAG: DUF3168 domain-containing protein [Pseudomonadota bacterium]|nr:DUF3168 domain-containing protein [Pseudomonadota bacterium]